MTHDVLMCPACGGGNLHHYQTDIYNRSQEDSDTGLFVSVRDQEIIQSDFIDKSNPSLRRDGIRLWLTCEGCNRLTTFEIAQHKGETQINVAAAVQERV